MPLLVELHPLSHADCLMLLFQLEVRQNVPAIRFAYYLAKSIQLLVQFFQNFWIQIRLELSPFCSQPLY